MLNTVWLTEKRNITAGTAMLLGGFDGLHAGHRQLLSCAKTSGLPVGIMTIIGGKEDGIFTLEERADIFKNAGIDFIFELPFAEIKDMTAEEFLHKITENFQPKIFLCGEDFRFGAGVIGTPEMIKRSTHVRVEVLPLLKIDNEKVSSRQIKSFLANGKIEKANAMLTHEFFLMGEVVKDRQIGRTLGFPTANIHYPKGKYPLKKGVYETCVMVDDKEYKGITNYGARPTFANEIVVTETYLDGFQGDLYGKKLKVKFKKYLRDITKFESVQGLQEQLIKDIERVRKYD